MKLIQNSAAKNKSNFFMNLFYGLKLVNILKIQSLLSILDFVKVLFFQRFKYYLCLNAKPIGGSYGNMGSGNGYEIFEKR
jgi:hypothetical protein